MNPQTAGSSELARAGVLVELRRWDEAIAVLGRVVASDPSAARPRCLLAQALLGADRPRDALEQAGAAAAAEPDNEWAHRLRSIALRALGDRRGSLAAAREAVRLAPGLAVTYVTLVDAQLAVSDLAGADVSAKRAVALGPDRASSHITLGRVALAKRRSREAEAHFREALRLEPENAIALNNLGVALQRQLRRRSAVAYFASASKADPHNNLFRRNAVRGSIGLRVAGVMLVAVLVLARIMVPDGEAWYSPTGIALFGLGLAGWAAVVLTVRSRARRHADPTASTELIRSLRKQASAAELYLPLIHKLGPRAPTPGIVAVLVLNVILALGSVVNLVTPNPNDATGPAAYWFMLVATTAFAAAATATLIRRRRRYRREKELAGR